MAIYGDNGNNVLHGTSGDDTIFGLGGNDTLYGFSGNDILDGGIGADTMVGGTGSDVYEVDNANDVVTEGRYDGADDQVRSSITYTLGAYVEHLLLNIGAGAIDGNGNNSANSITGNASNNTLNALGGDDVLNGGGGSDTLYGGGGNDLLDGGTGTDDLIGGAGDDGYFLDTRYDDVIENANQGLDTVYAYFSGYSLTDNVENLHVQIGTFGSGNDLDNVIYGNASDNELDGEGGDDALIGGAGADTLIGGTGNDDFYVDDVGDHAVELADEGIETVYSTAVNHTLDANVENLVLIGGSSNGSGNDLDNNIYGNANSNILTGGLGNDHYFFTADNAHDTLTEFAPGDAYGDLITLSAFGILSFAELQSYMSQVGNDTVITFDAANDITLKNVILGFLNANDFLFTN